MNGAAMHSRLGGWTDIWMRGGWRVRQHTSGRVSTLGPDGKIIRGDPSVTLDDHIRQARHQAPRCRSSRGVILLHGLYHHPGVLSGMESVLRGRGFEVSNMGYSSAHARFWDTADRVAGVAASQAEDGVTSICFVGHSLGGLLAREAASRARAKGVKVDALVLIGSPARGARMASLVRGFIGPCRDVLVPDPFHAVAQPEARFLVVAGGTGGIGFNPLLGEDNDGVVGVSETKLTGGQFHLVRALHTPMARHPHTISLTQAFLDRQPNPGNLCHE